MKVRRPQFSREEHARLGKEIYERSLRAKIGESNDGKVVAIDVLTGAFDMAKDSLTASERLLARCPDAQIWCVRIGRQGVHRYGRGTGARAAR